MKKIILLFFILGCVPKVQMLEEVYYQLLQNWLYADQVKVFISGPEIIDRPPGAEILLIQLKFSQKSQCVYYLVPYKSKLGKLSIVENRSTENCQEIYSNPSVIEISNIEKLQINYANFNLKLAFERDHKKEKFEFPFYNVSNGVIHQKFKSMETLSLLSGMKLFNQPKLFLGQLDDRFSNGRALRCHQVNAQCETIGDYRCNECRYGWYEVVDYNCPQGGSKFCGQNHCGEKNEPACPRGYKIFEHEEAGICQSDLTAVYNSDHVLVCQ